VAFEETEALEVDPTALIGGLVVTIIGGIIVFLVQRWLESREKQRKKDVLASEEVTPPKLPTPKVPNNLPQPGEFIGRDREKAQVWEALASRSFLVSIDGIGGIGKTALALEAAHECLRVSKGETPADGIPVFDAFIWTTAKDRELALSDILDTIARTLDYPYIAQLSLEEKPSEAAKLLRAQKCLLIVDNFETITDDAVRDFLLSLPDPSKALVTSREQKLRQARAISLRGMEKDEALTLIRSEGKRLGLPAVENAEEKVLSRLYEATGGAPLAIKWAVGQMKQRGQSLDTALDYLYEARGDIFENIFSRSWSFLSENARRVLMVMPIFATSASKPAIQAASDVHKWDLDEAMGQLVEMWLVEVSEELDEAKRRYSVHPLTRAFAKVRLGEDKEFEEKAWERAAEYFLELISSYGDRENYYAGERISRETQVILQTELENIRGTLEWCYNKRAWSLIIDFVWFLVHFLGLRGYWDERIAWVQRAIKAAQHENERKTEALFLIDALGWVYIQQGEFDEAESVINEGLAIAEQYQMQDEIALAMCELGVIARVRGDYDVAQRSLEETLSIDCQVQIKAIVHHELGILSYYQGNLNKAELHLQTTAEIEPIIGDMPVSDVWVDLGDIAKERKQYNKAERLYKKELALATKILRFVGIARAKQSLAFLNEEMGNFREALELAQEALEIFARLGMKKEIKKTRELAERLESRITETRK